MNIGRRAGGTGADENVDDGGAKCTRSARNDHVLAGKIHLAASAFYARREYLKFNPVGDFADPKFLVENILADPVPPGQPLAAGVAVKRIEILGKCLDIAFVGKKTFLDEAHADAPHDRGNLPQWIFRVILYGPGDRTVGADF